MKGRLPWRWTGVTMAVLAVGACLALAALVGFSYQAVREWRRSEELLAERRARETADRLVTALVRDMRGAQNAILTSGWKDLPLEQPYDAQTLAGSVFARYPYPESFFAWQRTAPARPMVFFNRSDRPPPWMPANNGRDLFPVSLGEEASAEHLILARAAGDMGHGRRFSTFEMTLGGTHYQVVAGLFYRDAFHEELDRVVGFTVNTSWAREHYFPRMARQVARIGEGPPPAILDGSGALVAGALAPEGKGAVVRRWFPVMFFDPLLVGVDPPGSLAKSSWVVQARITEDAGLAAATSGAQRTLVFAAVAVATLAIAMLLTARAARASAKLAAMRSEFVSTVTHELKTPIATIRAIGDTLVRGRISDPVAQREYAELVVQEARRLGRLVENLLAYARITDLTEAYTFEPLAARELVDEALKGFRVPLSQAAFEVRVDVAPDAPAIRGDRTALRLALDNVLDNAIRYSDSVRRLDVRVFAARDHRVAIEVRDRGVGIPAAELAHVTRRFQRGRRPHSSGSGLGLAIVERIVKDHRGDLIVESREGEGTTVRLIVPAAEQQDGQTGAGG
jgi:signal transduction histidine kinase